MFEKINKIHKPMEQSASWPVFTLLAWLIRLGATINHLSMTVSYAHKRNIHMRACLLCLGCHINYVKSNKVLSYNNNKILSLFLWKSFDTTTSTHQQQKSLMRTSNQSVAMLNKSKHYIIQSSPLSKPLLNLEHVEIFCTKSVSSFQEVSMAIT